MEVFNFTLMMGTVANEQSRSRSQLDSASNSRSALVREQTLIKDQSTRRAALVKPAQLFTSKHDTTQRRTWTWTIKQLCCKRPDLGLRLRLQVADTILFELGEPNLWIFTAKSGEVLRRNNDRLRSDLVKVKLSGPGNDYDSVPASGASAFSTVGSLMPVGAPPADAPSADTLAGAPSIGVLPAATSPAASAPPAPATLASDNKEETPEKYVFSIRRGSCEQVMLKATVGTAAELGHMLNAEDRHQIVRHTPIRLFAEIKCIE